MAQLPVRKDVKLTPFPFHRKVVKLLRNGVENKLAKKRSSFSQYAVSRSKTQFVWFPLLSPLPRDYSGGWLDSRVLLFCPLHLFYIAESYKGVQHRPLSQGTSLTQACLGCEVQNFGY
jgi:hypothetical protein